MAVVNMMVGATAQDAATFVAKVDGGGPVRVAVADNEAMTSPVFTASQAVDAQGVAKVSITGLAPDTRHFWQVEDNSVIDTTLTGQFRTHPPLGLPGSYTLAVAGDAGLDPQHPGVAGGELAPDRLSNAPVLDTIRESDPLMLVHLGDRGYPDWGTALTDTLPNRRRFWDDIAAQPRQGQLGREVAIAHAWDDHDYAHNDSDGTYALKANAALVYRERMPHYPLSDPGGIWQSWQIGRVLHVLSDTRYYRSPNSDPDGASKTMLGAAQKTWLAGLLATSTAQALVWFMPSQWTGPSSDGWGAFATEQAELAGLLDQHGWLGRLVMVYADRHALRLDSGANNPAGGFPYMCAAAIDAAGGVPLTGLGNVLDDTPGGNQFGKVQVQDFGTVIAIRLIARRGGEELGSYQHTVVLSTPVVGVASVQEFAPLLGGSHDPVFEARVLTSFQSGPDPAGTDLPIVDGDVQFDATAQVHATLKLTTKGTDPATGRPWFPRLPGDLLAPYGNEVFVRRGVDLGGGGILWSPAGYFRAETVEQPGKIDADIAIGGSDRMAAIVESQQVTPREFTAITPVATFFAALVGAVYPDAIIVFDDDSALAELGRQIVVDESRYEPLLEVADGLGKVLYWDGEGFLRVESPPDETVPVWTVAAGRNGVLVEASRRLTRRGAPNGVLVLGEGGSDQEPVRGLAVDTGPRSPTRWGGPYGRVLVREQLTTVTTVAQAEQAARELLRRRLGVPHSADFGAITNPGLRPRHPIVVVQRDGNRDRHIVQTLTVPLTAAGVMSGTTRERTTVVIGSVIE